jgi:DMSO/TMAO reductase YedYZ molybdopterin-dependent catalytic subunit
MADRFLSRGFFGRRRQPEAADRLPPGQYVTPDFPVLSAGPTPRIAQEDWTFTIGGLVREPVAWNWREFTRLPAQTFTVDVHCVTKWSKLDTRWKGVSLDVLLKHVDLDPKAGYVTATCYGGYTTNLPLPDILNGKAFVASEYDGPPSPNTAVGHWWFRTFIFGKGHGPTVSIYGVDRRGFKSLTPRLRRSWKEQRYQVIDAVSDAF